MCGIAGFLSTPHTSIERGVVAWMTQALSHRGPDDSGEWIDAAVGVALGHRRLSIVDLSPLGHQPMMSACGRYVIAYNGEIYNHLELRSQLHEQRWRGRSDTETVLACISRHGVQTTLGMLVGMFAMAVWDRERRTLT